MADQKIVTEEALSAIASDIKTDLGTKADTSSIPTKVSDLTNDSGFQTGDDVDTAIAMAIANKADRDGEYDFMTVGLAKQLKSNVGENDKVPYNFRTSGGSIDIGERETNKIIGGTVAFNQLVRNGNFASVANWTAYYGGSYTVSNNEASLTGGNNGGIFQDQQVPSKHKLLISADFKGDGTNGVRFTFNNASITDLPAIINSVWTNQSAIISVNANVSFVRTHIRVVTSEESATVSVRNVNIIDLTAMFGSTIADYIYTLESGTAGAGVAFFRSLFPKPYYAYNAGELMSVKTSAHVMTGFNQLDKNSSYVVGSYRYVNTLIGVTNELYMSFTDKDTSVNVSDVYIGFTDINKETTRAFRWIINAGVMQADHSNKASSGTPNKLCGYVFVYPNTADVWDRLNRRYDICVNLSWDGERDGEYEPYEEHTYALDSDLELRGIPKLDANNKLYYDGDTYESDGTVTRKYGIVDLGSLAWSYNSNYERFTAPLPSPAVQGATVRENCLCYKYVSNKLAYADSDRTDKVICINTNVFVRDSAYTDKDAFKTAMSGVYLVYEIATPTTETADTFTNPQIVNDFGTEEYVDTRDVPIPVGHDTFYQANLRAKLEMVPDSPSGNGDYIVRQTDGQNEYVALTKELPTLPTTDGTYTLKCTVSGGTPTLSWVADT